MHPFNLEGDYSGNQSVSHEEKNPKHWQHTKANKGNWNSSTP